MDRKYRSAVVSAVLVLIGSVLAPAAGANDVESAQIESIADRTIGSSSFEAFAAATAVAASSPVLDQAGPNDLVVTETGAPGPAVVAVVLKPAGSGTYVIPAPPATGHYEFLNEHLEEAADLGVGSVVFPPGGSFLISESRPVEFEDFVDVDIDLNGSEIVFDRVAVSMKIGRSERLVLRNGTIRGTTQLASVARVRVVSGKPTFEVLEAFRDALERSSGGSPGLETVGSARQTDDGGWRLDSDGFVELFTNRKSGINEFEYEDGTFMSTSATDSRASDFVDGDLVWLLHQNNAGHGLLLDNKDGIEDITLKDLTFVNIPGMAVVGEVKRGLHIDGLVIDVDDTRPAVFGASSDGVHINANGGDIVIENSYLGPNADDKITVKGNYWRVATIDRSTNTVEVVPGGRDTSVRRWGNQGDRVVFIDDSFGVAGEAVMSVDSQRASTGGTKRHEVRFDSIPVGVGVGSLVGNVDNSGGRVIIRNNAFVDTRSQAILVQTSHVAVTGNSFDGVGGPTIKLNMALEEWFEGVVAQNVLIRGNTFAESSQSKRKSNELIHFYQRDANGTPISIIGDVRIEGNSLGIAQTQVADPTPLPLADRTSGGLEPHVPVTPFVGPEPDVGANAPRGDRLAADETSRAAVNDSLSRLYLAYFDRVPDPGGWLFWNEWLRQGRSLSGAADLFARSPEFDDVYGSLSAEGFVDLVYRNVLGRRADAGGRAFWLDQMADGLSRGQLMVHFSESPEYLRLTG